MKNAVGREIPDRIAGYRSIKPFTGAFDNLGMVNGRRHAEERRARTEQAPARSPGRNHGVRLKDGATISFHHHLRNGDHVLNMVLAEIARLGLKDIKVASSRSSPSTRRSSSISEQGS